MPRSRFQNAFRFLGNGCPQKNGLIDSQGLRSPLNKLKQTVTMTDLGRARLLFIV